MGTKDAEMARAGRGTSADSWEACRRRTTRGKGRVGDAMKYESTMVCTAAESVTTAESQLSWVCSLRSWPLEADGVCFEQKIFPWATGFEVCRCASCAPSRSRLLEILAHRSIWFVLRVAAGRPRPRPRPQRFWQPTASFSQCRVVLTGGRQFAAIIRILASAPPHADSHPASTSTSIQIVGLITLDGRAPIAHESQNPNSLPKNSKI